MKKIIVLLVLIFISCSKESDGGDSVSEEKLKFTLTVSAGEGGSVDTAGGTYPEGTSLTITATPDTSYEFDGWSGTETSSENPLTFNLTSNENVIANFIRQTDPIIGIWKSEVFFEGTVDEYVEYITFEPDGTLYVLSLQSVDETLDPELSYFCSGSWSNSSPNDDLSKFNQSYLFELTSCTDGDEGDSGTVSIIFQSDYQIFSVEGFDGNYSLIDSQDSDGDSVPDHLDLCPDTPQGEEVDEYGCAIFQRDTDNDGVTDDLDQCPNTPAGIEVNPNGCDITIPVYLDENGVTIKAYDWAEPGDFGPINGVVYTIVDEQTLRDMISSGEDVTVVCTSRITNMFSLFDDSEFNQDIKSWDVSNVTDMSNLAYRSPFNQDVSYWDVSNVKIFNGMFGETPFNQDISSWDVSNATNMGSMFIRTPFNQDISSWDVSNVTEMGSMFKDSEFNQNIGAWDISNVTFLGSMFEGSKFDQNISSWDVSNVDFMSSMFRDTPFNQDLSAWDVQNVTNCIRFSFNTPNWTLPKPNFTNCNPD